MAVEIDSYLKDRLNARALWFEAAGRAVLRDEVLAAPRADEALVATRFSALSRGTERLVFEGRVPQAQAGHMRAPFQAGEFSFPVKFGYCAVGEVLEGPAHVLGRRVFCLHPHQDVFVAPLSALRLVPDAVPTRRATLAASLETALNALWDSGAGPGDRIVVIGAGMIGLMVTALSAGLPGAEVFVCDRDPERRTLVEAFGARFVTADQAPRDADLAFHASASAQGLALALDCAGLEAKVVEMSWYGAGAVEAPLGGAFHHKRLRLISSQVGQVANSRRPRWSHARRLDKALALLADPRFDGLLGKDAALEVAFADLPRELPRLLAPDAPGVTALVRY
jgi:NADPH:quinone reductase-like Zn-dependent oxidoreductase